MNLIERDRQLIDLCAGQRDKTHKVTVLRGAIASGKTALLREYADRELAAGHHVLHALGSRVEGKFQSGIIRQLFSGLYFDSQAEQNLRIILNDGMLWALAYGTDEYEQAALRIMDEFWIALREISERKPVTIIVDDIHYADFLSVEFLLYIARRVSSMPVAIVVVDDGRPWRFSAPLRDEFLYVPGCHTVRVPRLSAQGTAQLVAEHADNRYADHLAVGIHHASGGNPLLVRALIEDYDFPWKTPGEVVTDVAFTRAVQTCLNRCDPDVVGVAQAMAVLDEPATAEALGRMLRVPAESAQDGLTELGEIGLAAAARFRCKAIGPAVLGTMSFEDRAALHMQAAHMLHHDNERAGTVARHLIAAGSELASRSARDWAVTVLRAAAERALADSDVSFAQKSLRLALELGSDDRERAVITSLLAAAEWRVDPGMADRHLPGLTRAAAKGLLRGRDAARLAHYQLWRGMPDEAFRLIADAGRAGRDAHLEDQFLVARTWAMCLHPDRRDAGDDAECAWDLLDSADPDGAALAFVATRMATSMYSAGASGEEPWSGRFTDDDVPAAREAEWTPTWRALRAAIHAIVYLRRGDLRAARRRAHEAIAHVPPKSWGVMIGVPVAALVLATTAMGALDDAAGYLAIPVPDAMFRTSIGPLYLNARARYHLAAGRPGLALRDFELCGSLMRRWDADQPEFVPWRVGAAEAHLVLEEERECLELLDDELRRPEARRGRVYGMWLRVRAAASSPAEKVSLLRQAIEVLQECGDQLECARALADIVSGLEARGERGEAKRMRRKAAQLAKHCGLHASDSARAGDNARRDTGGVPAPASDAPGLSEAEQRVVALAARGYTNREIAEKLYITASTVEQHLTRAYRKLQVSRRADLALLWGPDARPQA